MVDAGAGYLDPLVGLAHPRLVALAAASVALAHQHAGDLHPAALHAVAQADGVHTLAPIIGVQRGPGVDGHGVGVAEEQAVVGGHLGHVALEGQYLGHVPLAVHDAAGAEGIAHALVHTVLERYLDVELERLQPADARAVDDIVGACQRLAPVQGGAESGGQAVGSDVLVQKLPHHVQVALVDVVEREVGVSELGHLQDVAHELPGEPHAARADERHLHGHMVAPCQCTSRLRPLSRQRRQGSILRRWEEGATGGAGNGPSSTGKAMEAATGFEPVNDGFANRCLGPLGYAASGEYKSIYRRRRGRNRPSAQAFRRQMAKFRAAA